MNDRELLERAAKAAGYTVVGYADAMVAQPGHRAGGLVIRNERGGDSLWHPGEDDGDALRLAVALRIDLLFGNDVIEAGMERERYTDRPDGAASEEEQRAAVRRCIVRAAAAMAGDTER